MPSLNEVARRDEIKAKTLHLENPSGAKFTLDVEFYINRVTTEPLGDVDLSPYLDEGEIVDDLSNEDVTSLRNAIEFCEIIARWDLTGPLVNRADKTVIAEGALIPLAPRMVRLVPLWLRILIVTRLMESLNPNPSSSRNSRRR